MTQSIYRFFADESGLTTVEYAIAGALIGVAVILAFTTLGGSVAGTVMIIDGILPG
ncbi:MAG: Flp family type IVb pilin [Gammaproteobacteria bacterium]|nr:MAG: Flp family type IVb pilin [Gammaproteobacteria bacterium]